MFDIFYRNNDPLTARVLIQEHDGRFLVQNPPSMPLSGRELDRIHELDYQLAVHPYYRRQGEVKALETIRFALATHRGCYGECSFCAIAVHQGRTVSWRSRDSLVREARRMTAHPEFRGIIHDVGGPTANMYGFECRRKLKRGACARKRCLYPQACPGLKIDHRDQIRLLEELRGLEGVRKVAVASGIRYDMILADEANGLKYLRQLVRHHVSGQLKIAPEHSESRVLDLMGKPGQNSLLRFRDLFQQMTREAGLNQYLAYYMIAAHPGCTLQDMQRLRRFCTGRLKVLPRQVQIFTPTPSTYATLMYWTGRDPFSGKPCFVEKTAAGRQRQKQALARGKGTKKSSPHPAATGRRSGPRR
jgi:uncharacterized radical SAM protein YgiQ